MGNISLGHSSALDASGKLHEFRPGDELPGWVTAKQKESDQIPVKLVAGDEASEIIARAENDAAGIIAKAEAEAAEILANAHGQVSSTGGDESNEHAESEPEKVEPAAEPDFTQPAPAKRGRPRKQV